MNNVHKDMEGASYFQLTSNGGVRCSSAAAYLDKCSGRRNLSVVCDTVVNRVDFSRKKDVAGNLVARGVTLSRDSCEGKSSLRVLLSSRACAKVILSAGSIGSPHILARSGVGDSLQLGSIDGFRVLLNLPESEKSSGPSASQTRS